MNEIAELKPIEQEEIQTDLRSIFRGAVRMALETVLEEEVTRLCGLGRGERGGRKDVRNGSYLRGLLTEMGHLEIKMPRTRASGAPTEVIGRYKRRAAEVDEMVTQAYVHGVSTRDMSELTRALMGEDVSRSTVSRITKRLEENVEALKNQPIDEPITYLYLDATFLDTRWARRVENVAALVAYGVGAESGKRKPLAITIGAQESEASWTELLEQLIGRGLDGVRLVIADAHAGLAAAVRKLLPEAERQRCTVHFMRNVLTRAPARLRGRLAKELSALFKASSRKDARSKLESLETRWRKQLPELVDSLKAGFPAATRYFDFPERHWRRIRSTNGLERLHGEIKRRTRAVGAFPDRASALRLITAVVLHATAIWDDRRYLDMTLFDRNEEIKQAA